MHISTNSKKMKEYYHYQVTKVKTLMKRNLHKQIYLSGKLEKNNKQDKENTNLNNMLYCSDH